MKPLILLVSLILTMIMPSYADVVRLAAEDSWPPFANSDGSGISRVIIEKAYGYSGQEVEFIIVPYARALNMAKMGQVDGAFNVTKQASTEQDFVFGKEPLLKVSASFYYHPSSKLDFSTTDEIPRGTSIATIIGYEYGDKYEANRHKFDEVRVASQQQIIKLLRTGRVDMAIMFDDVAASTLEMMMLSDKSLKKGAINHTSDIYVAFNKSLKQSRKITALDLGLKAIQHESAYITP